MNGYHEPTDKGNDYPAIRAWEKHMGAYGYYIDAQLKKARETKAPINAIYERNGQWHTLDDIVGLHTRPGMQELAEIDDQLKAGVY